MDNRHGISSKEMTLLGASSGISAQFIMFMKKTNTARQHFAVYNEMMASEIAAKLGITVPDWFIGEDDGNLAFFSRFVRGLNIPLSALLAWDHGYICRLALFNLFIMNEDLGVAPSGESHFRTLDNALYIFDFGGALLGHSFNVWSDRLKQWTEGCPPITANNPCSAVRDAGAFEEYAKQLPAALREDDIVYIVHKAKLAGLEPAIASALTEYLLKRRETFVEYAKRCQVHYPNLQNTSPAQA